MESLIPVLLSLLPALVIVAGLRDLTSMTIPNWISLALIAGFYPVALIVGLPLAMIGLHTLIAIAALLVGMGLFALRWIGGGDAKLMAAACLWLGLQGSGLFLLWTALAGGAFCLLLIVARRSMAPLAARLDGWPARLLEPKGDIPYGVAIAAGALMAFPASALVQTFVQGA